MFDPVSADHVTSIYVAEVALPDTGKAIIRGTVLAKAPEVLTVDEGPVPFELIADTLT